jgi:hypothetical protein
VIFLRDKSISRLLLPPFLQRVLLAVAVASLGLLAGCRTPGKPPIKSEPAFVPASVAAAQVPTTASSSAHRAAGDLRPSAVITPRPAVAIQPVNDRSGRPAAPSASTALRSSRGPNFSSESAALAAWRRSVAPAQVRREREEWLFQASRVAPAVRRETSLYEDSITLSRLRGELKKVADLPASVRSSARVRQGVVSLQVPLATDQAVAAAAVRRALDLPEVREVRLRELPPST